MFFTDGFTLGTAIVLVALYGMPYQIDKIMAIADKYGITVIEDAAEGMGSRFNGQVLGTFGKYGVLSLTIGRVCSRSAMLKRACTLLSLNRILQR